MESSQTECKSLSRLLEDLSDPLIYHQTIRSIETKIGTSDSDTRLILACLAAQPYKSSMLLSLCSLILLENVDFDKTVELINSIFNQCNQIEISNYIKLLQNSKFYLHRLAVPYLIKNRELENTKTYLKNALEDTVEYVVRTAILSLKDYNTMPFTESEVLEYATTMFESGSDYLEPNCVDLLLLVTHRTALVDKILASGSWKTKLSLAKKLHFFAFDTRDVALVLARDSEDEIRIVIAQSFNRFECDLARELVDIMVGDPNPIVRSYCIEQICKNKSPLPDKVIFESWEVTLTLLKSVNKRLNFEEITFPIINSLKSHKNWRIRKTIVETCHAILAEGDEERTKEIFFQFFFDKVSDVRSKVSECLFDLIGKIECSSYIENILKTGAYKNRLALVKCCVKMDEHCGTNYVRTLAKDGVSCVKLALLDELRDVKSLNTEILLMINEMVVSKDEELSRKALDFLANINDEIQRVFATHKPTMNIKEVRRLRPGEEAPGHVQNTVGIHNGRSYVFGVLMSIDTLHFMDSKTGRYAPTADDLVIGKVFYRCADYYKLDLRHAVGTLPSLAFKNATKRFKPELDVGDYVIARITGVGAECTLSCVGSGLGKLEGYVMELEPWKVRKLYMCSFLQDLGKKYRFSCALGLNGRVWIHSDKAVVVRDVMRLLGRFS
ncbi:UNVERIFIED_CONTAM: hypothetical protein PYX00_011466 [Menopon gallinae]|uniref:Ribosomal RNA-processing protein 40 n=1 Tax=Menopon gallinae TaxID=328185 RepID=A0AAW2H7S2_9NEOP